MVRDRTESQKGVMYDETAATNDLQKSTFIIV